MGIPPIIQYCTILAHGDLGNPTDNDNSKAIINDYQWYCHGECVFLANAIQEHVTWILLRLISMENPIFIVITWMMTEMAFDIDQVSYP